MEVTTIHKEYLSVPDAANILGVHRETIYRLIARGKLKASKPTRKYVITKESIDNLIKSGLPQVSE